jgi:hypothetical protein
LKKPATAKPVPDSVNAPPPLVEGRLMEPLVIAAPNRCGAEMQKPRSKIVGPSRSVSILMPQVYT